MKSDEARNIISAFNAATHFGSSSSDYYDFGNVLSYLGYSIEFKGVTCVKGSLRQNATGISVYFPYNKSNRSAYIEQNLIEEYADFVKNFFSWQSKQTISFLNYGESANNQLRITVSEDSVSYIGNVEYVLYSLGDGEIGDNFYALGNDVDVNILDNQIFITFTGRWVEFGGKLLYCLLIDRNMNNPIYEGLVTVDGREARLIFSFDETARTAETIGVTYADDDFSRIYDLSDGMQICVGQKVVFDGEITDVFPEENTFTYSGEEVEVVSLSDGYYQYTAYVRDVYGTVYAGGTAVVKIANGSLEIVTVTSDSVAYPE